MIGTFGQIVLVLVFGVVLWNIARYVYESKPKGDTPLLSSLPPLPPIVLPPVSAPSLSPRVAEKTPSKSAVASDNAGQSPAVVQIPANNVEIKKSDERLDMHSIPMFTQRKNLIVD